METPDTPSLRYGEIDQATLSSAWPIVEAWFRDNPEGTVLEFTQWVTNTTGHPWDKVLTSDEQERLTLWISADPTIRDMISMGLDGYP